MEKRERKVYKVCLKRFEKSYKKKKSKKNIYNQKSIIESGILLCFVVVVREKKGE